MRHALLTFIAFSLIAGSAGAAPDYDKQIFPLLDRYCSDCHGPDDPDGEFRIDTFSNLMAGGEDGPAIKAGHSADSLLVKFLEGRSGRGGKNEFMPPGKREKLKPAEIALIKQWIDAGAGGPAVAAAQAPKPRVVVTPKIAPKMTPSRSIQAVAWSDSAKFIAAGRHGEIELLNPVSRAVVRKLTGFKGQVNAITFSPDGASVYAAGGEAGISGDVHRWRVADGGFIQHYEGHLDACYALALCPDGKILATAGYDQKIKLWNADSGKELATLKGHNGAVNGLAFRPDGRVLASASTDRTVKLWAIPSGERLDTLSQPTKEQIAVVFSTDGKKLYGAGADNRIRVWNISSAAKEGTNSLLTARFAHEGGILALAMSPDGKLLASTATDHSLKVFRTSDLSQQTVLEDQPDWSSAIAFGEKTQLITGRVDGTLAVYDSASGKVVMVPKPAKPELSTAEPRGLRAGGSTLISITGKNLAPDTQIHFSNPALKGEIVTSSIKPTQATVRVTANADLTRGGYDLWLANASGESARIKLFVDDLTPITTKAETFHAGPFQVMRLPASLWGTLTEIGQHDRFQFQARAGEELVFDLAVAQIGSTAKSPTLEILDPQGAIIAVNRGLDSGSDPFLAWKAPSDGDYIARVSNTTMDGSRNHIYRLTIGAVPFVTAWSPLTAQVGKEVKVTLIGHHLDGKGSITVTPDKGGMFNVPVDAKALRFRTMPSLRVGDLPQTNETEPNDDADKAQFVTVPATINGRLAGMTADTDHFAFDAKKGQSWIIETLAAQAESPADTKIELVHADGSPVPRMLLQAVRDSYNNFRSVDADNPDIRLQNWEEMDLNEYVWFNGDIMQTFRMPRGPDSGFLFYNNKGKRRAYFDTTAAAHSLDEPCYTVVPHPLDAPLVSNGLPIFTLNYANDDEGYRRLGRDSRLTFTAPADGRYIVRVTDTRGWSGERFIYSLTIREPVPDFTVQMAGANPMVGPGDSIGFSFRADRLDGFDGPIQIEISGVPSGYYASTPLVIEAGHDLISGSLHAAPTAPKNADWSRVTITAKATIAGKNMAHAAGNFGKVTLGPAPKFAVVLEPDQGGKPAMREITDETRPLEITLTPGKTVKAWLRAVRQGSKALINLDIHGLPHGVIIDDIGLNGVQIREGESERPIFLRAAKWVAEQDKLCHAATASARTEHDSAGLQTSFPVLLKIGNASPSVTTR